MHRPTKADALSVLFILYNVLYIAAVGILFSSNGQNRYRLEATPLICVLLALLVNTTWPETPSESVRAAHVYAAELDQGLARSRPSAVEFALCLGIF